MRYAFFDGDNIGNTIENLLNSGRVREASQLSESIKDAVFQIEKFISSFEGAELIIAGGDDVLIKYNFVENEIGFLKKLHLFSKHILVFQ